MIRNTTEITYELRCKATILNAIQSSITISIFFVLLGGIIGAICWLDNISAASIVWAVFLFLAIVIPIFLTSSTRATVRKIYEGPCAQDKYTVNHFAFDDNYMYARSVRKDIELSRETTPYELVVKIIVHEDFIQVFITEMNLFIISKSGMTEGTYEELAAHLAAHVPQNIFINKIKAKKG